MQILYELIKDGYLSCGEGLHSVIYWVSSGLSVLFFLLYFHQFLFLIIGTVHVRKPKKTEHKQHKLGIVISARNEEKVIGNLIDSIYKSDYPRELYNIFVIADNCTDSTKQICEDAGCIVFERNDPDNIGKGRALHFFFEKLHTDPKYSDLVPEAYIIMDADNVMKSDFITEINKIYDEGYEIVTSYRNTKNFSQNWISSGYGLWFLHESRHLNNSRMILHSSCSISGTGFLISTNVVKGYDNWKFFTMTEDIECATDFVTSGRKVGYAATAEFYDEQPTRLKQSYVQRERWAKGYYQVLGKYWKKLVGGSVKNFACWDIFTTLFPALFVTIFSTIFYPVVSIVAATMGEAKTVLFALESLGFTLLQFYPVTFIIGLLITITEWKKISCSAPKKILYMFTFPLFMYTYIPIAISAIFRYKKIVWTPIVHTSNKKIEDVTAETEEAKQKNSSGGGKGGKGGNAGDEVNLDIKSSSSQDDSDYVDVCDVAAAPCGYSDSAANTEAISDSTDGAKSVSAKSGTDAKSHSVNVGTDAKSRSTPDPIKENVG